MAIGGISDVRENPQIRRSRAFDLPRQGFWNVLPSLTLVVPMAARA